jgi:hypothetical protein
MPMFSEIGPLVFDPEVQEKSHKIGESNQEYTFPKITGKFAKLLKNEEESKSITFDSF